MCETKQPDEKQDQRPADETAPRGRCGCSCQPKRCLPLAGGLLAAVAVGLVIGAVRRSRQEKDSEAHGRRPAGCCT